MDNKVFVLTFSEIYNDYWAWASRVEVFKERSTAEARRSELIASAKKGGMTFTEQDYQITECEVKPPIYTKEQYTKEECFPGGVLTKKDGVPISWEPEPGCNGCCGCPEFDICTWKGGA